MRFTRQLAVLIALLLIALMAPGASAQPAPANRKSHIIKHLKAGEIRNSGRFFVKGQVTTYPGHFVKLQKRKCKKCNFKPYKKGRTSKAGSFRMNFDAPVGHCFRLLVPGTTKYRPAARFIGCIVRGS